MAITTSNVVQNARAITWQYTGDGATTASTATFTGKLDSGLAISQAFLTTAPTNFATHSGKGGLVHPQGTAATVASSSINTTTGVVTVTASVVVVNATVAYVCVVLNHEAN